MKKLAINKLGVNVNTKTPNTFEATSFSKKMSLFLQQDIQELGQWHQHWLIKPELSL